MPFISHPFVWLMRFRKRKGYGVHSPFAFNFITDVIDATHPYYAYHELDRQYSGWQRSLGGQAISKSRLLYRLVNHQRPERMLLCGASVVDESYMLAAAPKARRVGDIFDEKADFIYISQPDDSILYRHLHKGSMLVVDRLRDNMEWWRMIKADHRTRVTFELYDLGIAFFDPKLQKQDYKVNW